MFTRRFSDLAQALKKTAYQAGGNFLDETSWFYQARDALRSVAERGGIVYVIGNGGSAGIASHFSNDLLKARQIPSQTFYDSNVLTCLSNDLGYDKVFSYPLQKLLKPQDLLVAISSSGQSQNILNAADVAVEKSTPLVTLSGFQSHNPLRTKGALNVWVGESDYGLVENAHFFLLHTLIDFWDL